MTFTGTFIYPLPFLSYGNLQLGEEAGRVRFVTRFSKWPSKGFGARMERAGNRDVKAAVAQPDEF